jgi:hypothetical protein
VQDLFGSSKLEFKIVHPPPEEKLDGNDQLPSIHYYVGSFQEGLQRVEGAIERYAARLIKSFDQMDFIIRSS